MLRLPLPLLVLVLPGCAPWTQPYSTFAGIAAVNTASVAVFGRAVPDLVYSGITGNNCSVVRLEQGKSYCKPMEPPPAPPPFCTHSLGTVDCWINPEALNGPAPHGVADGPRALTPEQETNRTARWPNL
jgi:hypothetical protein